MQNLFVYGSLRKGHYNFDSFPSAKYISTHNIKGWDLYALHGGAYPGVVPGDNSLEVDLIQVNDQDYDRIKRMELGAGYLEIELDIEGVKGKFYPYKHSVTTKVESGNWNNYKNIN